MIHCSQCGQGNADQTQFCRFCGSRLTASLQQEAEPNNHPGPPRPYAWKTDEYQTQTDRRVRNAATHPLYQATSPATAQPPAYSGPQFLGAGYRCPNCGTNNLPIAERRISKAGWITFAVLLVTTFIFFWIGLCMKENVMTCPVCRIALN